MNLDRLKYRYWQHTDWHDTNSPLEAVYCNAVDGCDPTIAVSDFEFCTGLKDKNGNLIYEGDIVRQGDILKDFPIRWNGHGFNNPSNGLYPLFLVPSEWEIIGNIHEQKDK